MKKLFHKEDSCSTGGGDGCSCDAPLIQESSHVSHDQEHSHDYGWLPAAFSFVLLVVGYVLKNQSWFSAYVELVWYLVAYLPVAFPVVKSGWKSAVRGDLFTEFFLMSLATICAFLIGEYQEAVAVMLFYTVGELFQEAAVSKARSNIKSLLDMRPESVAVLRSGILEQVNPSSVAVGETIRILAGERVGLDGVLLSVNSSFNTAALSGESIPVTKLQGETVLSGMINVGHVVELQTTQAFANSTVARMMKLVQEAVTRKAQTELFIRKFARIYTPAVVALAALLTFLPYFFVTDYVFKDWLYRALVFLVISCPCALVISIPLGYFSGIGAASRLGILFKGGNYLDALARVNTVVMDKTGTLTKGVFRVQEVVSASGSKEELLKFAAAVESNSTHPIAKAIVQHYRETIPNSAWPEAVSVKEVSGMGLMGKVDGTDVLVGHAAFLKQHQIILDDSLGTAQDAVVLVAVDGQYAGFIRIADEVKPEAKSAIQRLRKMGINEFLILSGDNASVVSNVAQQVGVEHWFGQLLPEDKLQKVEALRQDKRSTIAFVGDGINDAPVLALSDVGIAMGELGSDVAIETADVILQTDNLLHLVTAIKISRATRAVVWQNITLALGVKGFVMLLGAFGYATMWSAVFADVGVALLAILNAVRIQYLSFD